MFVSMKEWGGVGGESRGCDGFVRGWGLERDQIGDGSIGGALGSVFPRGWFRVVRFCRV